MSGCGALHAVTVAVPDPDPPAPVQVSVKPDVAVTVWAWEPDVACVPLQLPEAVHAVALAELQVSVTDPPLRTFAAEAVIDTVGIAGLDPPPPPLHPGNPSTTLAIATICNRARRIVDLRRVVILICTS